MAEDFNDLIDQTETRAQALVIEADKAIELLDSVDAMVDNLSSTIEESANEAKESFDTLSEQITTAEDTLQTQQEAAKESMNGLMQQMQEAGGRIQESLTNAFNKFSELQGKKQDFLSEVGEELGNVGDSYRELGEECSQTTVNIQSKLEPYEASIDQLADLSSSLLENSDKKLDDLDSEIKVLIQEVDSKSDSVNDNFENFISETNSSVDNLDEPLQYLFTKSVEVEQEKFVSGIQELNTVVLSSSQQIIDISKAVQDNEDKLSTNLIEHSKKSSEVFTGLKTNLDALKKVEMT